MTYVGNGKDHVFGGSGNDRLYGPGQSDALNCGAGRDLAYANILAMAYAGRHGCERVRMIKQHQLH